MPPLVPPLRGSKFYDSPNLVFNLFVPGGPLNCNVVSRRDQENAVKGLFFRSSGVRVQRVKGCKISYFQEKGYLFKIL